MTDKEQDEKDFMGDYYIPSNEEIQKLLDFIWEDGDKKSSAFSKKCK